MSRVKMAMLEQEQREERMRELGPEMFKVIKETHTLLADTPKMWMSPMHKQQLALFEILKKVEL